MRISVQLLQFSTIVIGLIAVIYVFYLLSEPNTFSTSKNLNDEENRLRVSNRGMLTSIVSQLVLNTVGTTMAAGGVPQGYIIMNFGKVLAPVIGYLLDIGFATKSGFRATQQGVTNGMMHAISSLASPQFFRYVITDLLDTFISSPIQDAIRYYFKGLQSSIPGNSIGYGQLIKDNYPFILQSTVSMFTYHAYIYNIKFNWAYTTEKNRIPTFAINLAAALSASFYVAYTVPGAENLNRRIPFTMLAILLLSIGNSIEWNSVTGPPITINDATNKDLGMNPRMRFISGSSMLVIFIVIGFIIPVSQATKHVI